jgi:hypothetical protein
MCSTKKASPEGRNRSNSLKRIAESFNPFGKTFGTGPTMQFMSETRARLKGAPRTRAQLEEKRRKDALQGEGSVNYRIPTNGEDKRYNPATGLRR